MKKFVKFLVIWISQQLAIPFWIVGHVHIHFSSWADFYDYGMSILLHIIVAIGFWLDWKQSKK
tara:strand:+ start:3496 stop:3684 length:189 start_codon:yes stop_codon:yes gene_type:complete